jgi:two-component system, OmpR family, response regulator
MSTAVTDSADAIGNVILIIGPAVEACPLLGEVLVEAGFVVRFCQSSQLARSILAEQTARLVILAHQLPGVDTMTLLRELVEIYRLPTIISADKSKSIHRILALEMGADDFITQPCEPDEILARVRAILRRTSRSLTIEQVSTNEVPSGGDTFRFDGLAFDLGRRELRSQNGALIELTSAEIDLLGAFVIQPQVPLSRLTIIERMGKTSDLPSIRTIDVLISKLRRKIEASADQPELIKTVRGSGYVFTPKRLAR